MLFKENCWEFMKCGRELNGHNVHLSGVCPAVLATELNAMHAGINGGRACWIVAGTFCNGEVQGTFACKEEGCSDCLFFEKVLREEIQCLKPSDLVELIDP